MAFAAVPAVAKERFMLNIYFYTSSIHALRAILEIIIFYFSVPGNISATLFSSYS
jgi:hypothetical protein